MYLDNCCNLFCCSDHLKNVEELCIRICFSFFHAKSGSTKIIEVWVIYNIAWVIYNIKALSTVIRTTLKNFEKKISLCREKPVWFFGQILSSKKWACRQGRIKSFLEEGGGFSKTFRKFCQLFLGGTNRFFELSRGTRKTLFSPRFLCRSQNFHKQAKKAFLSSSWKVLTKNCVVSARASPSKLLKIDDIPPHLPPKSAPERRFTIAYLRFI